MKLIEGYYKNILYMRVISNMFRTFQIRRLYHPLRTQMTVVNVYSSCTGIKNLFFFFSQREDYLWARPKHNSNKFRFFP